MKDRTAELEARLVRCLPAGSHEMETLCRLAGLVATTEVPSAAVECTARPRLLINPDFVDRWCRTDEHLFLLVMHELWHVLMAHTRLYPRATPAQNIAFDAVINAGLARQFPGREYRGFLEAVNPADRFPALLLRPPEGWPLRPRYPESVGPPGAVDVLRRLYPPDGDDGTAMPLYSEILALLERSAEPGHLADGAPAGKGPGPGGDLAEEDLAEGDLVLLGDHGDENSDLAAMDDPLFGAVVRRIVASWPRPPFLREGRDLGRALETTEIMHVDPAAEVKRVFRLLLRRVLMRTPSRATEVASHLERVVGGAGVLPNPSDRTWHARRRLQGTGLLWNQAQDVRVRRRRRLPRACVYLDVSGSMGDLLPHLVGLLVPFARNGEILAFQFSTRVRPLGERDLARGRIRSTGGTAISCVVDHLLEQKEIRRALILTDGYTGSPNKRQRRRLREGGYRLHVVLPDESAYRRDLEEAAATLTVLPPLNGIGGAP